MRYDPETLTVKAGETITFELVNDGRKSHELTVTQLTRKRPMP